MQIINENVEINLELQEETHFELGLESEDDNFIKNFHNAINL
jgi:hypothetical protein